MKSLYQTIFACAPVGIEIYDQDGLLIDANAKCLELFGISRFEHVRAFRLFEDPNVSAEHLAVLREGGTVHYQAVFDFDLVRSQGLYPTAKSGRIDVDVTIAPVSDLPGRHAPGYLVVVQDVTSQNRVQEDLRRSEEKHRILVEESPDPVFCLSREGRYEFANRALAEGFGRPRVEIVGLSLWDVFPESEADRRFAVLGEVFRTGESRVVEGRVPRPDGVRYYVTTVNPVRDAAGRVVSTICSAKDITERKQAEEALELERQRLQRALDEVKTLRGIVPICASCKRIRDDRGYWNQVEVYVGERTEAEFSHGVCPECMKRFYPEYSR